MKRLPPYADERQTGPCAYCGRAADTRDHVPSRVLLTEPHPQVLPWVPACRECNESYSSDEQYLACVLECVLAGTTKLSDTFSTKIRRTLEVCPSLAARIEAARVLTETGTAFTIELERVERVLLKLARGHACYELGEPQYEPPTRLAYATLITLSDEVRAAFEAVPETRIWPEVGSRAMQRILEDGGAGWIAVQPSRYRFLAHADGGVLVRIVIAEYLAAEARWD